jgi:integration host factor subunit beta
MRGIMRWFRNRGESTTVEAGEESERESAACPSGSKRANDLVVPRASGREGGDGSMTKSKLIEEVARQMPGMSKRDVEIVVETIFKAMTDALVRRDRIEIRGFGSFIAKKRRAREGRNPRKPDVKVSVPQKHVPFFTCGKELRERVNELTTSTPT